MSMTVEQVNYDTWAKTKEIGNSYKQLVDEKDENALRTVGRLFHWKEYKDANTFVSNVIDGPKTLGGTISQ